MEDCSEAIRIGTCESVCRTKSRSVNERKPAGSGCGDCNGLKQHSCAVARVAQKLSFHEKESEKEKV